MSAKVAKGGERRRKAKGRATRPRYGSAFKRRVRGIGQGIVERVFIYWDNSNILIGARAVAEEREGMDTRHRVRISFKAMMRLAHAGRPVEKAIAAGSVPPELRALWNSLSAEGVAIELFDRGAIDRGEQQTPDRVLQLQMLRDFADYNGDPGIVVLLTGDGQGFYDGAGFHADLERMHRRGWRVEVLSWANSCNQRMRQWVEGHGVFVPLDDFYEAVTFLKPSSDDYPAADVRYEAPLDLERRQRVSATAD